jgi:hypothetical protein
MNTMRFEASPHGDYFDWQENQLEVDRLNRFVECWNRFGEVQMRKLKGKDPTTAKPSRPQVVVFGQPGIGKTWTALDFPSCYYIDCEGGANLPHYTRKLKEVDAAYLGPEDGANDFETVIEEVITLATTEHDRKTLIIDSFSKLFATAIQIEHDRMIAVGEKPAFGSEKKPAIAATRRLIRWLGQLDMNVLLICHEKAKWSQGEQVGFEPDTWEKMLYELNLILQVYKTGQTRRVRVIKSRFEQFAEAETLEWTYQEFAYRFGQEILEGDSHAIDLATADQVKDIKHLVEVLKIGPDEVTKVWDWAGVTRWEDMTKTRIAEAIKKLQGKMKVTA